MLRHTNKGFSLIELLVAMAIISSLSLLTVHLLYGTVATRAKQYSIEGANDNMRLLMSNITKEIQNANIVSIDNYYTLKLTGDICRTIIWNRVDQIKEAVDKANPCLPPAETSTDFFPISKDQITINKVEFSSLPATGQPKIITIKISGIYNDNFGSHPVNLETSVTPRVVF
ncbi:MAG: type II secretion system protein [Candidatus Gottesmanbacteria bacterium]